MVRRALVLLLLPLAWALSAGPALAQEGGARRVEQPPPAPPPPVLTRPPELIEGAAPVYPPQAAALELEASVTVRLHVDATGAVAKVDVVTPKGHGFDEAAVAAAMQYRFRPAEWDGKPGPIVVETTIHFTITHVEVPEVPGGGEDGGAGGAQAPADAGIIRGIVKERGTRKALVGVAVGLEGTTLEAVTGEDGRFVLEGVPPGRHRVLAALPGYDRYDVGLTVEPSEEVVTTLYLRPRGGNPYETVIEAEREKLEVTKRTMNRRQLTTVPGTFGDPLRAIQNLPGMNRAPYVLGVLLIRGSNPDDSGVYVDGHEVPLLYHFLGGPSILNPEFLDSIDLYPGGFPARFGRNMGGIVEVATRKPERDGLHGSADVDLLDSSLYLRASAGPKVTFAFAARRSYIDTLLPFFLPETEPGETLIVVPVYWDYQVRADVDLPGRDELSFMFFGSDDTLDLVQSDAEEVFDLETHIGFNRVRGTYLARFGSKGQLALSISPSYGRDVFTLFGADFTRITARQSVFSLRERLSGPLRSWLRIDAGLDLEYRISSFDATLPIADDVNNLGNELDVPPEAFTAQVDSYGLAAWFEAAIDLPRDVRVIPGLRLDTYLLAGEPRASLDPRLVVRWQIDGETAVKGYGGLFHQAPSAEGFSTRFGNPDLELEYAIHAGAGVERKLAKAITGEAEVYWVGRRNQSVFVNDFVMNPDGTVRPLAFDNRMIGRTVGLELLVRHDVTRNLFGWVSYTLSSSENQRAPGRAWEPNSFDQRHSLIGVASYRTDGGWEVGTRFRLVTGRPETRYDGSTYDADDDDYRPITPDFRGGRRATFHQLDLRAEKTWLFDTWSIAGYLDVQNVYNAENPEATQWDYRYRNSAPVRGLPIVPTLGVKGQW